MAVLETQPLWPDPGGRWHCITEAQNPALCCMLSPCPASTVASLHPHYHVVRWGSPGPLSRWGCSGSEGRGLAQGHAALRAGVLRPSTTNTKSAVSSRGCLAMSGDTSAVGRAPDAAQHPTMHKTAPTAKHHPAQRSTVQRWRNPAPPTFQGLLRDSSSTPGLGLPEKEVSLCQGDSGSRRPWWHFFPLTEAGSWKTEQGILVAFLLLFSQPKHLSQDPTSAEGLQGPDMGHPATC